MTEGENQDEKSLLPAFTRNNYFFGKLLTASDFRMEQEYFINKMRLLNRLIHGTGIVCGLKVKIGSSAGIIEVSEGFALDAEGREVLLTSKYICDLNQRFTPSDLDGRRDLFATIRYDESKVDPIPSLMEKGNEYNVILEGSKIEVELNPPEHFSTEKIFLAKLRITTNKNSIHVDKIEDFAVVNNGMLKRINLGMRTCDEG